MEKITDPEIAGEYTDSPLDRMKVINTMLKKINESVDEINELKDAMIVVSNFQRELVKLLNDFTKNKKVVD